MKMIGMFYHTGLDLMSLYHALYDSINHLLLLKHRFDDGDFNMHTLLDYVPHKRVMKLAGEDVTNMVTFAGLILRRWKA